MLETVLGAGNAQNSQQSKAPAGSLVGEIGSKQTHAWVPSAEEDKERHWGLGLQEGARVHRAEPASGAETERRTCSTRGTSRGAV